MLNTHFATVDRKFYNQESASVHVVRLRCEPVRQFLESVKSVYRTIDFADEYQAQLGKLLWKLRCSVLFGLAPYDHKDIRLLAHGEEISCMAERLPGSRESVALLKQRLSAIVELKENPKLEWILKQNWSEDEPTAIFALMAMRKSFGTDLVARYSQNLCNDLGLISSLEHLGREHYSTLVMPGTLQYLSHSLFMKIFHRGEFRKFHVLLYEGESLCIKSRVQLPESLLFPGLSEGAVFNVEKADDVDLSKDKINEEDLPNPAQIFGAGGGTFKGYSNGCPARFLICDDGLGFYVAENERVRVWLPDAAEKLSFVYPLQLLEGDFIILEKGQRQNLLDHSDINTNFSAEVDATGVWREPLRAMLLSRSPEEVANHMMSTGHIYKSSTWLELANEVEQSIEAPKDELVCDAGSEAHNLGINISKWASGQVYGPRGIHHFLALIQVLVECGYIQIESPPDNAARQWFKDLEKLRAGRRAAGMNLNIQIDRLLEDSLEEQTAINDGLELLLDNGMLVSVHQLAMISEQISAVPESLLRKPV